MKAVEQHAPIKSDFLSLSNLGIAISWRRVALYVTLSLGFFLLGFVPMWLQASRAIEQRDAAHRGVRLARLQNILSAALVNVQRGEYEPARQLSSEFYANLRSQIDNGNRSVFTPAEREKLKPLLSQRDEVITLLARSDPAAAERLFTVYSSYNKSTNSRG